MKKYLYLILGLFPLNTFASYSLPNFEGSGFSIAPIYDYTFLQQSYLFKDSPLGSIDSTYDNLSCNYVDSTTSGAITDHSIAYWSDGYSLALQGKIRFTITGSSTYNTDQFMQLKIDSIYTQNGVQVPNPATDFEQKLFEFRIKSPEDHATFCYHTRFYHSEDEVLGGNYLYKIEVYVYDNKGKMYHYIKYFTEYTSLGKIVLGNLAYPYDFLGTRVYNFLPSSYTYGGGGTASYGSGELNSLTLSGFLGSTGTTNSIPYFLGIINEIDTLTGTTSTSSGYYDTCGSLDIGCYLKGLGNYIIDSITNGIKGIFDYFMPGISFNGTFDSCGSFNSGTTTSTSQKFANIVAILNPFPPRNGSTICTIFGPKVLNYNVMWPTQNFFQKYIPGQIPELEISVYVFPELGLTLIDIITIFAFIMLIFYKPHD